MTNRHRACTLLSTVGNVVVLHSSAVTGLKKRWQCSIKYFIANLALTDLTTLLTIFDFLVSFLRTRVGGEVSCKLQNFVVEAPYTWPSSILIVSFERRKAVAVPFGTRTSLSRSMYRRSCAVWIASLSISLAHPKICTNIAFGDLPQWRQLLYCSIHGAWTFIFPLTYMIYA